MTLEELRDALANATGPSWRLEREIAKIIYPAGTLTQQDGLWFVNTHGTALNPVWEPFRPQPYTASIDTAVTLVPDGFHWSLDDRSSGGFASAWIVKPGSRTREVLVRAKTPALAICLARVEYELQRAATPGRDG